MLQKEQVVLLDLWAGRGLARPCLRIRPGWDSAERGHPEKVQRVWETVRDARDAAIALVMGAAGKRPVAGFEADRAARSVIEKAGWGGYFVHRTGHSIDRDLHGSGPHLDDYETHDDRELIQGSGSRSNPGFTWPASSGSGAR